MSDTTTINQKETDLGAFARYVEEHHAPEVQIHEQVLELGEGESDALALLVRTKAQVIEDFTEKRDALRQHPRAAVGFARLKDERAFLDHFDRHAQPSASVIFADPDAMRLVSVLDYHDDGVAGRLTLYGRGPNWCRHGGIYQPAMSPAWKAWLEATSKPMTSIELAAFLEDRIIDVVGTPMASKTLAELQEKLGGRIGGPSDLVSIARNLKVNVKSTVRDVRTLSSGEMEVAYTEQHEDGTGQPLTIPSLFAVVIPVFFNGVRYQLPFRLRYRIAGGSVNWQISMYNAEEAVDLAFAELVARVRDEAPELELGDPDAPKVYMRRTVFVGSPDHTITVPA